MDEYERGTIGVTATCPQCGSDDVFPMEGQLVLAECVGWGYGAFALEVEEVRRWNSWCPCRNLAAPYLVATFN